MDIFGFDVLSVLIIAPALGALVVAALPPNKLMARWVSLFIALAIGALAVVVFYGYQDSQNTFAVQEEWFTLLGASWHLGIDGISATMVLLTGILVPLAILISWEIDDRVNMHLALILFFETGLMGVFVAQDMMIFFLFYELSLVPIYFLIDQWGGKNRKYAATKFMIYSIGGTLGMLLATQLVGWTSGTFDIAELTTLWPAFEGDAGTFLGANVKLVKGLSFVGFFVAFCIKVPVWPFHTWLPDAHGEAPTAGSMLLAGVMLKLGAYGFIRLVVPLFPDVWAADINFLGGEIIVAPCVCVYGDAGYCARGVCRIRSE